MGDMPRKENSTTRPEVSSWLRRSISKVAMSGLSSVRYPRDNLSSVVTDRLKECPPFELGKARCLTPAHDVRRKVVNYKKRMNAARIVRYTQHGRDGRRG